jgi:hypothetical protein
VRSEAVGLKSGTASKLLSTKLALQLGQFLIEFRLPLGENPDVNEKKQPNQAECREEELVHAATP